jgi:hypothetical protein
MTGLNGHVTVTATNAGTGTIVDGTVTICIPQARKCPPDVGGGVIARGGTRQRVNYTCSEADPRPRPATCPLTVSVPSFRDSTVYVGIGR